MIEDICALFAAYNQMGGHSAAEVSEALRQLSLALSQAESNANIIKPIEEEQKVILTDNDLFILTDNDFLKETNDNQIIPIGEYE